MTATCPDLPSLATVPPQDSREAISKETTTSEPPKTSPDPRRRDFFTTPTPRGLDPFPGAGFSSRVVF
eukprot:4879323-Pyramimonas_sp.AAC.1